MGKLVLDRKFLYRVLKLVLKFSLELNTNKEILYRVQTLGAL